MSTYLVKVHDADKDLGVKCGIIKAVDGKAAMEIGKTQFKLPENWAWHYDEQHDCWVACPNDSKPNAALCFGGTVVTFIPHEVGTFFTIVT